MSDASALREVARYYTRKLEEHGPTPKGVDWSDERTQAIRFEQLLAIVGPADGFTINDYGCGYGALADYLLRQARDFRYTGFDISPAMIAAARQRFPSDSRIGFTSELGEVAAADFTIASGVLNVKLGAPPEAWRRCVVRMIDEIARISSRGMAFNALTSHTDPGFRRPDLYYADPAELLDHCLRNYARDVVLRHDYELFEFSVLVRLDGRPPAAGGRGGP